MAYTEAIRRANDKWLANNYRQLAFRVNKELANDFIEACKRDNQSQAQIFKKAMEDYLNKHPVDKEK